MYVLYRRCVELPEVHTEPKAAGLFLHHDDRRDPGDVGRADDATGQHLLDLGHLFSMNSGVLAAIRLAEQRSFGLYGVQPRSSSPWLTMSLNSWKRAFSCCCWVGDRCAGTGGRRRRLEAAGGAERQRRQ